ncbi:MAG: Oligosaccharide translocation protein rft1 [Trichoglossum hirsutum]|nr:MAG: Oligosaccharide translocation protein rft1 [Trichoglossum hirsutum]
MATKTAEPSPSEPKPKKCDESPERSLLSTSAQGATFLILLQIGSRALTFGVNQLLLRYLSPEHLGISTQLELYLISVLYFARESLRVALQRQAWSYNTKEEKPKTEGDGGRCDVKKAVVEREKPPLKEPIDANSQAGELQTIVNLSYLSIYFGIPLAFGLGKLYLRSTTPQIRETPYFRESLDMYGVAIVFELIAEPAFVVVQHKMLYKTRAMVETAATLVRCLVTCGIAVLASVAKDDAGVLPFAVGQWAYASTLFFMYYWQVWMIASNGEFSLIPVPISSSDKSQYIMSYYSRPLLILGASLFVQSAVKHVLTQGDSLLIATFSSLQDQGIYALASNYGSLVARMLFQPIEESSRNLFAKMLSSTAKDKKPDSRRVQSAANVLADIIKLYVLISIVAAALGPGVAPVLLRIFAGSRWMSVGAGVVLSTYCYYIPLLALNGVTEAFISSVATGTELHKQSVWMSVFSLGFAGAGYLFLEVLGWGAQGLVWANFVNMALRILWSSIFIADYLQRNGGSLELNSMLPHAGSVAAGLVAWATLARQKETFTGDVSDITKCSAVGGALLVLL